MESATSFVITDNLVLKINICAEKSRPSKICKPLAAPAKIVYFKIVR